MNMKQKKIKLKPRVKLNYNIIPNQWIALLAHSDWLLKLGIVSAIELPAFFWVLRASFPHFAGK